MRSITAMRLSLGIISTLALTSAVSALDPILPDGEGVAAIDAKSGEWLWQAWVIEEVPQEFQSLVENGIYSNLGNGIKLKTERPKYQEHDLLIQHRWTEELPSKRQLVIWERQKLLASADIYLRSALARTDAGWFVVNSEGRLDFFERAKPRDPENWGRPILPDWQLPEKSRQIAATIDDDRIWIANSKKLVAWNPSTDQQLLKVEVDGLSDLGGGEFFGMEISLVGEFVTIQNRRAIACFDRNTGEQLWTTNHFQAFDGPQPKSPPNHPDILFIELHSAIPEPAKEMMRNQNSEGASPLSYINAPPIARAVAAAEMARALGDGSQRHVLKRRLKDEQLPKAATPILERIIESDWPKDISIERLVGFCTEQLTASNPNNPFPREAAWLVLQSQLSPIINTTGTRQASPSLMFVEQGIPSFQPSPELVRECHRTLKDGPNHEHAYAACLLLTHAARTGDTSVLKELLIHPTPEVWPWAAAFASMLQERELLVEGLQQRPLSDRIDSLAWLRSVVGESYWEGALFELTDAEIALIVEALEERSFDAAGRFGSLFDVKDNAKALAAYPALLDQARKLVRAEAEESAAEFNFSSGMEDLIMLISAAADPEDNAVLEILLDHPYVKFQTNKETQKTLCLFPIREAAARALLRRGVELPADVVFQIEVATPEKPQ
ncbi:MAG: hypothetical protein AAF585_04475 [Verrucomicrobiota bacterium]